MTPGRAQSRCSGVGVAERHQSASSGHVDFPVGMSRGLSRADWMVGQDWVGWSVRSKWLARLELVSRTPTEIGVRIHAGVLDQEMKEEVGEGGRGSGRGTGVGGVGGRETRRAGGWEGGMS